MTNVDVYYSSQYLNLSAPLDKGEPESFYFENALGAVLYRFVKRSISTEGTPLWDIITPYGYGGPVVTQCVGDNRAALAEAFDREFTKYCDEQGIVSEFVRFSPIDETYGDFGRFYETELNRNTVVMRLTGEEALTREIAKKVRWRARKNRDMGLSVTVGEPSSLVDFTRLYDLTMRRNSARDFYFFDHEYFDTMVQTLSDRVILAEATFDNKVIASSLFLVGPDRLHYHLSGTDPNFSAFSPTTSLLYGVAEWSIAHGFTFVHLGGGRSTSSDDSLLRFKRKFGSELRDFFVGKRIHDPRAYERLVKATNVGDSDFFPAYRA